MQRRQQGMGQPYPTGENQGMGQAQPVRRPSPMGAQDQSQPMMPQPPPPPIQPMGQIPGMDPMSQAMPGGGGQNTDELMQMLMSLLGSGGQQGY